MQFSRLLKTDDEHSSPEGLRRAFGDSYLVSRNPVYGQVRRLSKLLDYKYVEAWPDYLAFPLGQLDKIVRRKLIPVKWTRNWVEDIVEKIPGKFSTNDLPLEIENYHMHEAAHGIAESLFKGHVPKTNQEKILKAMMCESFANATEGLTNAFARNETHRVFLSYNSYIQDSAQTRRYKAKFLSEIGARNTFILIFFSYLHANFLYRQVSDALVKKVLRNFGDGMALSRRQILHARRIMSDGMELSLVFRGHTNGFYLRYAQLYNGSSLVKTLDFDFLTILCEEPKWHRMVEEMANCFADVSYCARL